MERTELIRQMEVYEKDTLKTLCALSAAHGFLQLSDCGCEYEAFERLEASVYLAKELTEKALNNVRCALSDCTIADLQKEEDE